MICMNQSPAFFLRFAQQIAVRREAARANVASRWAGLGRLQRGVIWSLGVALLLWMFGPLAGLLIFAVAGLWSWFHMVGAIRQPRRYEYGKQRSQLGRLLFLGLSLGLAVLSAFHIGAWLEIQATLWALHTPLTSLVFPISVAGAALAGLGIALLLFRVPRHLDRWRLAGRLSAVHALDASYFGLFLVLFIFLRLLLPQEEAVLVLAQTVLTGVALYSFLNWLFRPRVNSAPSVPLWLVLPTPQNTTSGLGVVERIAQGARDFPVTLVCPPQAPPLGDHLHLADRLGLLDRLFPRMEIELSDWADTLPPAERWRSVPYRQVHPTPALMPALLETYQGRDDRTLLLCGPNDDLSAWRGLLPVDRTRVLVLAEKPSAPTVIQRLLLGIRRLLRSEEKVATAISPEPSEWQFGGYPVINPDLSGKKPLEAATWFAAAPMEEHRPTVFISFAGPYRTYSRQLANLLRPHLTVRYDADLLPGDDWTLALPRMLEESDAVVVLVGSATSSSQGSTAEIQRAIDLGKRLIPVFVDQPDPSNPAGRYMAANTDSLGQIAWLHGSAQPLEEILAEAAERILKALQ